MANPFTEWRREFLVRRALEAPTGLPLYSYRLSADEFSELEQLLRTTLAKYLQLGSLGQVTRQVVYFSGLFVLYAAEWWRRKYDGSGWAWEPILSSLHVPPDSWTPVQRSGCVESGLREWKLELTSTHGFRFLGSIAFQGGLPMQLLATARGNIGRVLGRVLRLASTGHVGPADILAWVSSLSGHLPKAYRQDEIYVLLAQVIVTVLDLKRRAGLEVADGAVDTLDRFDPEWRNQFPVPVEDTQARALVEQLVRDVAVVRFERAARKVFVERRLIHEADGNWHLEAEAEVPDYMDVAELAGLFGADPADLGRLLVLRLERGGEVAELQLRRLAGRERYRISRYPTTVAGESATAEHTLSLHEPGGQAWQTAIAGGEALVKEMPWVFEPDAGHTDRFRFLRQGSGGVKSKSAALVLPCEWDLSDIDSGEISSDGSCLSGTRRVCLASGDLQFRVEGGRFRVRCGRADVENEQYEWRGNRAWDIASSPKLAFRGLPVLYKVAEDTLARPSGGNVAWKRPGGTITRIATGMVGPVEAVWPAEGTVSVRTQLLILPDDARVGVEPGASPMGGEIRFSEWRLAAVEVNQPDVTVAGRKDGKDFFVRVDYIGTGSAPEWCELGLLWEGNPGRARVRLPFPTSGGRAFDGRGVSLQQGERLAVDRLHGVRLVGFLGTEYRASLRLRLQYEGKTMDSTVRPVYVGPRQHRVELRLIDYLSDIQKMLSDDDRLDDEVVAELVIGSSNVASLSIARYACELHKLEPLPAVGFFGGNRAFEDPAAARRMPVAISRLDRPGDEPVRLEPTDVPAAVASWEVPVDELEPGTWLIYPSRDSELLFRPLAWPVQGTGESSEDTRSLLASVLGLADPAERATALGNTLRELADDFLHPDWQLVAQLASHLGHLPLATLDVWREFAKSPSAMAGLAMRFETWPEGFVARFALNMPWMWECVNLETWKAAMRLSRDQCDRWYPGEAGAAVFHAHLDRRLEDLSSACPALRAILEVGKSIVTGEVSSDVRAVSAPAMDAVFAAQLFDGADSHVQKLFHRHADEQWPVGFAEETCRAAEDWRAPYLCPRSFGFRDAVIHGPVLLALALIRPSDGPPPDISTLARNIRKLHSFDPDWFDEACNLTIARALSRKDVPFE